MQCTQEMLQKAVDDTGLSKRQTAFAIGIDVRTMYRYLSPTEVQKIPYPTYLAVLYVALKDK